VAAAQALQSPKEVAGGARTRLIAMGSPALMAGFALIGFETWPQGTRQDLERLLRELEQAREGALVFLEAGFLRQPSARLARIRAESPRIIVTEIPPLQAPGEYRPAVEDLVVKVLGSGALEENP
jgi:vacuolar-type H+-ATPase subunit F/Vma7